MPSAEQHQPPPTTAPIGATLERARHAHRIAVLTAALRRLERIAEESRAAGREVPHALRAAQQTFSEECDRMRQAVAALDARLAGRADPLPPAPPG